LLAFHEMAAHDMTARSTPITAGSDPFADSLASATDAKRLMSGRRLGRENGQSRVTLVHP
jgi:hypothetical protein